MITHNDRWPDLPVEDNAEQEAHALLEELAQAEIYLRLDDDRIRWMTTTTQAMTIAQIRAVKRLDGLLRTILARRQA